MQEWIASTDAVVLVTTFLVVALATLALALLWEGGRRYLQARKADQALEKIGLADAERRHRQKAGEGDLMASQSVGPAWLEPILLKVPHRDDLQRLLVQAGSRWSVGSVVMIAVGLAVAVGLTMAAAVGGLALPIGGAALGAYLPVFVLKRKRMKRFAAFEEGFPDAIDLLGRAARAGHSLAMGLEVVSDEAEEPVATEFRHVYEEQRFGIPMEEALLGLADRVDIVDVRIFVTSVLIQRESGGNLAENLDGLAGVIRARFRFRRDVKTKTAHGRMTGLMVAAVPFLAGAGMYAINPQYMEPLLVEPMGRTMLAVGAVMMVVGFLVIRRLVDLKY